MMIIDCKYELGEMVYLKTDKEQTERIITGILVNPNGFTYRLNSGAAECWAYEMEIAEEKNVLISSNG